MKDNGDSNRLQRLEALYEAVCNWAGEREVRHPSDGALLKALWTFEGDYTGPCPGCDAECDKPLQACSVAEAHARIDAEVLSGKWAIRDAQQQQQPLPCVLAARDVLAERQRQLDVEGWTPEHDDQYTEGELALAAACYAASSIDPDDVAKEPPRLWPLPAQWWKPSTAERMLKKAGGLLLAEMERRRRMNLAALDDVERWR